ncbi:aldehyde dehydrogenase (NADP(+)) [Pontibacter sp. JH31]|uniref:Aldehyde dehydrogenase (NADP(+)) n=1 Tax=Pontibacter aquaedesilientis TaxID=2766980 RepID=A0ABR7XDM8_9BACT|nr:aldehyde dehydrogenase (NADP(+)) [Pontibacter aquaedesilientis]MBD1396399.1 aldehyde dehydrogenase (NADP(+)) [Pontibacter aquaedesilientis]
MPYDDIFAKAEQAFARYKKLPATARAHLLRTIADEIDNLGDELLQTAHRESHLPLTRLTGERGRTVNQLRLFASLVEEGTWLEATIDTALPDRTPIPRPDLRRMLIPLGPVVVFGASNFPLAFSTAGGDTASALAAGCPVVYKEHPAHPQTSQLVYAAIKSALQECELPEGIFQHVRGGKEVGKQLVEHPQARAVAFTGSYQGGKALFDLACRRVAPIPVYAEMGSVNPIFVLPEKAVGNGEQLAAQAAQSVLLGVGQFCTCPGLIFYPAAEATPAFLETFAQKLRDTPAEKMLHETICRNYYHHLKGLHAQEGVDLILSPAEDILSGGAALAKTTLQQWLQNPALQEEIFGPYALVVTYEEVTELQQVAKKLQGQLTCTLWGTSHELQASSELVDLIREKCGRLLFSGVPTGVEVSHAMTHGGPFPATTDSRSTSVGTYAIKRFARPVTFQSAPQELLPEELKDENPLGMWRTINGQLSKDSL